MPKSKSPAVNRVRNHEAKRTRELRKLKISKKRFQNVVAGLKRFRGIVESRAKGK